MERTVGGVMSLTNAQKNIHNVSFTGNDTYLGWCLRHRSPARKGFVVQEAAYVGHIKQIRIRPFYKRLGY